MISYLINITLKGKHNEFFKFQELREKLMEVQELEVF